MNYSIDKNRFLGTPVVNIDDKSELITISGRSIDMNSNQFWKSMTTYMEDYMKTIKSELSIRFQMEYINSSSVEQLLDFLRLSKALINHEDKLKIEWLYDREDEDMLELGHCIHEIIQLPVKCVQMN